MRFANAALAQKIYAASLRLNLDVRLLSAHMTKVPIQDFSDEELRQRMYDLALNLYYDDQTLILPADVVEFFKETSDECKKRSLDDALVVPEYSRRGDHRPVVHATTLIRYGKRPHLEDLMRGVVSFGPSILYRDAPIQSQKDDETRRRCRFPNRVLTIGGVQYPASNIILHTEIAEIDGTPIHYHLFCAAREESRKLCRAFHADGFIRIRDYKEFFALLDAELKRICPKADIFGGSVRYYDDRADGPPRQLDQLILHKTIEYIYQRELRFAVLDGPAPGERCKIRIQPPEGLFELRLYEPTEI